MLSRRFVLPALISVMFFTGCAEKGAILLNIAYQPPENKAVASHKVTIGVSPFLDDRGIPAAVLGKRTVSSGLENDLVTQGSVAELVTTGVKDAVRVHGMVAKDVVAWNMTSDKLPADGYDIVIGGEIKSLWLDSVSVPFRTRLKILVQLKIVVGDASEKKVIRIIDVNSKIEQDVFYSKEKLASTLSEALSVALEQIFQDDVLKKKFS